MKTFSKILIAVMIGVLTGNVAAQDYEVPYIAGDWWQICNTQPDISPLEYTHHNNNTCDFTIFQDDSGEWHLVACIRLNTYPGSHRFLYHWTSPNLKDSQWKEQGIFWTTGYKDSTDMLGRKLSDTPYPALGKLQAPHCIKEVGRYYMFHNNDGAYCLTSKHGKNWDYAKDYQGNHKFFPMGRDVMIFDDRGNSGKWIAYYTDGSFDPQCVSARTSSSLKGPWSEEKVPKVYDGHSGTREPIYKNEFAESPHVVKRGEDDYYLFAQLYVFHSNDPLKFTRNITNLEGEYKAWAPEIIRDSKGNYYIAVYRVNGIWMAPVKWK